MLYSVPNIGQKLIIYGMKQLILAFSEKEFKNIMQDEFP